MSSNFSDHSKRMTRSGHNLGQLEQSLFRVWDLEWDLWVDMMDPTIHKQMPYPKLNSHLTFFILHARIWTSLSLFCKNLNLTLLFKRAKWPNLYIWIHSFAFQILTCMGKLVFVRYWYFSFCEFYRSVVHIYFCELCFFFFTEIRSVCLCSMYWCWLHISLSFVEVWIENVQYCWNFVIQVSH